MLKNRNFLAFLVCMFSSMFFSTVAIAQSSGAIQVEKLNYLEIRVSDPARSLSFYQGLLGLPVQARNDERVILKIGDSNQFMAIRQLRGNEAPAITQLGYSIRNFDLQAQLGVLKANGFREIDPPNMTLPGIENPMTTWVRERQGTPFLYFSDARGLIVQLTDTSWCGGSGPLGNDCSAPESTPAGVIELSEINHFTSFVNDGAAANIFYQQFFGLSIQAYQAPQGPNSPVTGIGDGKQFVMYAGGASEGQAIPANIHHVSFNLEGFNVEDIIAKLETQGITDQGERDIGPMMHYISLRMPARGGAEGGTPEMYFTDPDGILMQLQDITYCGGGGYLGNICL